MKKIVSLILAVAFLAVASGCTQYHAQGAGAGGVSLAAGDSTTGTAGRRRADH